MHVILDLDGTLIDSRPGVESLLYQAVREVLPQRDIAALHFYIGPPVRGMFQQALGNSTEHELDRLEAAFRDLYDEGGWRASPAYPGVGQTLADLSVRGHQLYIVTNKIRQPTLKILQAHGWSALVRDVITPDSRQPPFQSKSEMLLHLLSTRHIAVDDACYMGDTIEDCHEAEICGLAFIGVEYGYGKFPSERPPKHLLRAFSEVLDHLAVWPAHFSHRKEHFSMIDRDVFDELFVLELANNHWGDVNRGLRIIKEFGTVVRYNDVRAAIKVQLRDVDTFIHKDFVDRRDIRYIKKTLDTRLSREDMATLVEAIRRSGCVRVATPFDDRSVDACVELGIEIIKVASSDITDWPLLERIARTHKPVLVSTGGSSLREIDNMVTFFENRSIPLAINHCVSLYPSEDYELQLNQIDFLKRRYPGHVIGFSTHEYHDWRSSILIAYAKGARTFERHVDIQTDDHPISAYCSTPSQVAEWFHAFKKAKELCGSSGLEKAAPTQRELDYLTGLVRGVYFARDVPAGATLTPDDYYLAIPLQKGQLSSRELVNDQVLCAPGVKDAPLMVDMVDTLYNNDETLKRELYSRGL